MTDQKSVPLGIEYIPAHQHFLRKPPERLYHYTTLSGALGIIGSHSLWLTKIQCLNDTRELRHALDLAKQVASELVENNRGEDLTILERFAAQLGSFENVNICVGSFCENSDLLSQWRGYGASGQGVALGIRSSSLVEAGQSKGFTLVKCMYDSSDQMEVMRGFLKYLAEAYNTLKNDDVIAYFNTLFLRIAPAFKDRSFAEEGEWRIVTRPIKTIEDDYQVREAGGRLVPYYSFQFPCDPEGNYTFLQDCCLGPSDRSDQNSDGLFLHMQKCKIEFRSIFHSQVPFRQ